MAFVCRNVAVRSPNEHAHAPKANFMTDWTPLNDRSPVSTFIVFVVSFWRHNGVPSSVDQPKRQRQRQKPYQQPEPRSGDTSLNYVPNYFRWLSNACDLPNTVTFDDNDERPTTNDNGRHRWLVTPINPDTRPQCIQTHHPIHISVRHCEFSDVRGGCFVPCA